MSQNIYIQLSADASRYYTAEGSSFVLQPSKQYRVHFLDEMDQYICENQKQIIFWHFLMQYMLNTGILIDERFIIHQFPKFKSQFLTHHLVSVRIKVGIQKDVNLLLKRPLTSVQLVLRKFYHLTLLYSRYNNSHIKVILISR